MQENVDNSSLRVLDAAAHWLWVAGQREIKAASGALRLLRAGQMQAARSIHVLFDPYVVR